MEFVLIEEKRQTFDLDPATPLVCSRIYVRKGQLRHFLVEMFATGEPTRYTHVIGTLNAAQAVGRSFFTEHGATPVED